MAFKRSGVRFPSPPSPRKSSHPRGSGPEHRHVTDAGVAVGRDAGSAGIAQLVEHNLAKVGVAGSSPVSRSRIARQKSAAARSEELQEGAAAGELVAHLSALESCRAVSSVG